MHIVLYFFASVTYSSCCCNIVCCYVCLQQAAIALQVELDWAFFYLTNIAFILLLNYIYSFVLRLVDVKSRGLAYARQDILDVNML